MPGMAPADGGPLHGRASPASPSLRGRVSGAAVRRGGGSGCWTRWTARSASWSPWTGARRPREWLAGLGDRVVALGSLEAKGLEYDATVVVSPAEIAGRVPGRAAGDVALLGHPQVKSVGRDSGLRVLYVALTRATQQLTVLSGERDRPDAGGVPDLSEGLTKTLPGDGNRFLGLVC